MMCVLLFVAWTAEWPVEADTILYCGLWRSPFQLLGPFFVSVPGLNLFPWQLLLFLMAPLCLFWPGGTGRRAWLMDAAIVVSVMSVAVTFAWGWLRGGSVYNAYYQLWRFLAALLVAALLASAVRGSRDLKAIGATVLAAALVRGTLAIYFYWAFARDRAEGPLPYMTNHDDTLLFVAGVLIALSWALIKQTWGAALAGLLVCAHLLYAIVVNDRRLAWIELMIVLAFVCLVPRGTLRRRINTTVLAAAPLLIVYLAVGWGRDEAFFAPARALATASGNDDPSSLARQEEVRNLLFTLETAANPLLGTGWGVPYRKLTSVYANFGDEWWQYQYLPHNSLLALAVFAGLVGIAGIWLPVPVAAFLAMRGFAAASRPAHRAGALAALCILPAYGVQCFGDIGFQSLTGSLILGVALGVAAKVSAWGAA